MSDAKTLAAIDVHCHCVPMSALLHVRDEPGAFGVWWEPFEGTAQIRIGKRLIRPLFDAMLRDRAHIMCSPMRGASEILSVWPDLLAYDLPPRAAREWHGVLNSGLAEISEATGSPGWLACLTAQDPAVAADEIRKALEAGACGGLLGSNINHQALDHGAMDALWEAASDLGCPLFIHPLNPATDDRATAYNLRALTSYLSETTLAIASLILSGIYDKYPNLKLLLAHGGGTLPYQIGRIDKGHQLLEAHSKTCRYRPSEYLRHLYFDSITHSTPALSYLVDLVGSDRVMLGTDYPFGIGVDLELQIAQARELPAEYAQAIMSDNANRLFGFN